MSYHGIRRNDDAAITCKFVLIIRGKFSYLTFFDGRPIFEFVSPLFNRDAIVIKSEENIIIAAIYAFVHSTKVFFLIVHAAVIPTKVLPAPVGSTIIPLRALPPPPPNILDKHFS